MLELKGKYCKDCKIFTDNIDQDALSMIYHFLDHPMFEGSKIRIMPDVHAGKDIVVGFTVPFTDHVNPDHVGGDIGCSVSTATTDLPCNPEDYPAIEKAIREKVKFGMTIHQKAVYDYRELYKYLQMAVQKARQQWPEMVNNMDVSERGITAFLKRIDQSEHMFYHSIGTVGGGNHFVEVGITPDGNYAFTAHCGSRNLGQKVWKYWKMEAGKLTDTSNGYLTGDAMKGYITDMVVSQAYAEYNHKVIDGMGGHSFGETASETVCNTISDFWKKHISMPDCDSKVKLACKKASCAIDKKTFELHHAEMGTTMVMVSIENDVATIAHIGDSRCYVQRPGDGLLYQTKDHIRLDFGWEIVSRCFFTYRPEVAVPDIRQFTIQKGD